MKLPVSIYPFILFCLALAISVVFSQDKSNSLAQLYQYISGLCLCLIAVSLSEKNRLLMVNVIIFSGLIISLLAVYQYFFGFKHVLEYLTTHNLTSPFILDYLQRNRVFFPFVTPGALGGYLVMILLLSLTHKNRAWFLLIILPAFLLTKSLSAFFSLFCALIIYFGVQDKFRKKHILLLLGLFWGIVVMVIGRSATQKWHLHPEFSAVMRLNYWQESLAVIKAHPFTGVGLGNFNLPDSRYAHNSYLQIWAEMGILGLFSLLWIIFFVFKDNLNKLTKAFDVKQYAGLLAASTVFLIHNFLDFTFFLPEISLVWWAILGLTIAAHAA